MYSPAARLDSCTSYRSPRTRARRRRTEELSARRCPSSSLAAHARPECRGSRARLGSQRTRSERRGRCDGSCGGRRPHREGAPQRLHGDAGIEVLRHGPTDDRRVRTSRAPRPCTRSRSGSAGRSGQRPRPGSVPTPRNSRATTFRAMGNLCRDWVVEHEASSRTSAQAIPGASAWRCACGRTRMPPARSSAWTRGLPSDATRLESGANMDQEAASPVESSTENAPATRSSPKARCPARGTMNATENGRRERRWRRTSRLVLREVRRAFFAKSRSCSRVAHLSTQSGQLGALLGGERALAAPLVVRPCLVHPCP